MGLNEICSKFADNDIGNFPKFLLIMLFVFPVMLVLCSNINNVDLRFLLLECFIRVCTIQE